MSKGMLLFCFFYASIYVYIMFRGKRLRVYTLHNKKAVTAD